MTEEQVIELLSQLPDGVFITSKGRVAKIENGIVTELIEPLGVVASPMIVGGHQDPKEDNG